MSVSNRKQYSKNLTTNKIPTNLVELEKYIENITSLLIKDEIQDYEKRKIQIETEINGILDDISFINERVKKDENNLFEVYKNRLDEYLLFLNLEKNNYSDLHIRSISFSEFIDDISKSIDGNRDRLNHFLNNINNFESSYLQNLSDSLEVNKESFKLFFEQEKKQVENKLGEVYDSRLNFIEKYINEKYIKEKIGIKDKYEGKKPILNIDGKKFIVLVLLILFTFIIIFFDFYVILKQSAEMNGSDINLFAKRLGNLNKIRRFGTEGGIILTALIPSAGIIFTEYLNLKVFKLKWINYVVGIILFIITIIPLKDLITTGIIGEGFNEIIRETLMRGIIFILLIPTILLLLEKYFDIGYFIFCIKEIIKGTIKLFILPFQYVYYLFSLLGLKRSKNNLKKEIEQAKINLSNINLQFIGNERNEIFEQVKLGKLFEENTNLIANRINQIKKGISDLDIAANNGKKALFAKIDKVESLVQELNKDIQLKLVKIRDIAKKEIDWNKERINSFSKILGEHEKKLLI